MDGSFLFLFAQSVSGLIASFLFKIQRWNFLHQILYVAIQRTRKIFGPDKLVSFVDKNNAVLNIVKLSLPKISFYHVAAFITI